MQAQAVRPRQPERRREREAQGDRTRVNKYGSTPLGTVPQFRPHRSTQLQLD